MNVGCGSCSDGSSGDFSRRLSEYSLTASHSSRSRSSHDSSSSRVWDFSSPRESDWDVQHAATGSSSSAPQPAVLSAGAAADDIGASLLAPSVPRPGKPAPICRLNKNKT